MSQFENDTGLSDTEQPGFTQFQRDLAPYLQLINKVNLKILIWGPGERTKYFYKRVVIKDCLKTAHAEDEVVTSEELLRNIPHPSNLDVVQAEMLHAQVADVIFGLVTSDPQQTGIYMEIDNLLRFDHLVNKTWLIIPDHRDWKKVGSFIQQPLLKAFPSYRTKEFRTKSLEKCELLRSFCVVKSAEERGRKVRKLVNRLLSGGSST